MRIIIASSLAAILLIGCGLKKPADTRCFTIHTITGRNILAIDERYLSSVQDMTFYLKFYWEDLMPNRALGYRLENTGALQIFNQPGTTKRPAFGLGDSGKQVPNNELPGWTKFENIVTGTVHFVPGKQAPAISHVMCPEHRERCMVYLQTPKFGGALSIAPELVGRAREFANKAVELVTHFEKEARIKCRKPA